MSEAEVQTVFDGLPARRRADAEELLAVMQRATGDQPALWGGNILGFGTHHYRYASGREGDTPAVGFAPRKTALVIYGLIDEAGPEALEPLGTFTAGKGCVYVKRMDQVDQQFLERVVTQAYRDRHNVPG